MAEKLGSPDIIGLLTVEQLVGAGLTIGAATCLKKAFPAAGALGPTGRGFRLLRLLLWLWIQPGQPLTIQRTDSFGHGCMLGSLVARASSCFNACTMLVPKPAHTRPLQLSVMDIDTVAA